MKSLDEEIFQPNAYTSGSQFDHTNGYDPSIIFYSLACIELVWNACRLILILISIRYYIEIIKEVRQNGGIRLSDFVDITLRSEYGEQEFRDEMLNEYPGHGHRENVTWYCMNTLSFFVTMLLDLLAMLAIYFQSHHSLLCWSIIYPSSTLAEIATNVVLLRKCTNPAYLKRKLGHFVVTCIGVIGFRLYLLWISYYLLSLSKL